MGTPRSIKQICRDLEIGLGGQTRRSLGQWLDDSLFALWEKACLQHGGEHAACLMWFLTSKDPSFQPPYWLVCRYKAHRAAIIDAFGNAH